MQPPRHAILAAVAGLAVLWWAARPLVAPRVPHLVIWEYAAVALLLALAVALARPRAGAEGPILPFRRHAQVVRALPDPEVEIHRAALQRFVDTGEGVAPAAQILSQATGTPVDPEGLASLRNPRARFETITRTQPSGARDP